VRAIKITLNIPKLAVSRGATHALTLLRDYQSRCVTRQSQWCT